MSPGIERRSGVVRRIDGPRRRDHAVISIAIGFHKGCTYALRRAGDDGNFLFGVHDRIPVCIAFLSEAFFLLAVYVTP
jgi:hypothetical protein